MLGAVREQLGLGISKVVVGAEYMSLIRPLFVLRCRVDGANQGRM